MRRALPRLASVALASSAALALLTGADTRKPATEQLSRPAEAARVKRVETRLAPLALPGQKPQQLSLQRWMKLYEIPGLSVAVFDQGALVWAKGYGVTEAGGTRAVTPDTLFQAASISKTVTALAVLHQAEQAKWSLDADVNGWLRSWKVPENDFTKKEKVTLRRVLSHTAGLTVHGFPGYAVGAPLPTLQQVLDGQPPANTEPVRVDLVPGSETRYSGGGYVVLQQLLVDQLGKPFPQLMQETVLAPLGMKQSTFEQPLPAALAARAASGTYASGKAVPGRWHVYPELAPAGLWTTPSDLARVALELASASAGHSSRVVSPAMAKQLLSKQSEGYGLGVQLQEGTTQFSHGGWNEGFQSSLVAFSDTGSGVVMMANSDNGALLFERVAASIAAEYGWKDFQDRLAHPLMTADLLARTKGADAVLAWFESMKGKGPGGRGLPPQLLGKVGYGLLLADRVPEALKLLEAGIALTPDDAEAQDTLGEAYAKAGKKEQAIASYRKSLQLDPKNRNAAKKLEELGARAGPK